MATPAAPLGLIGLGTMGRNLALNLCDRGARLVVWERDADLAAQARAMLPAGATWAAGPAGVAAALPAPRAILLMVTAGSAVDAVIDALRPSLAAGDVIVDGGNADARDTARRQAGLAGTGIELIGLGVSGGEEGARRGPSLMAGGAPAAWARVAPVLEAIAARAPDGAPCCALLGAGAAGHFVKTVHNGIEYAVMQTLAETYDLMRHGLGMTPDAVGDAFERWNGGTLQSYLVEIAADVVRTRDTDGAPLLDRVVDRAGQKGTGRWASLAALDYGVPAPTIAEAVFARAVSSRSEDRAALAAARPGRPDLRIDDLEDALHAASIAAFVQGLDLIGAADATEAWGVDLAAVARVWRAGCILRAALLERLAAAAGDAGPGRLPLRSAALMGELRDALPGLRRTVSAAALSGFAVPAMGSALAWLDGMTRARVPADFLQGLRDRFGAHRFERTDRPGSFHADWRGS